MTETKKILARSVALDANFTGELLLTRAAKLETLLNLAASGHIDKDFADGFCENIISEIEAAAETLLESCQEFKDE